MPHFRASTTAKLTPIRAVPPVVATSILFTISTSLPHITSTIAKKMSNKDVTVPLMATRDAISIKAIWKAVVTLDLWFKTKYISVIDTNPATMLSILFLDVSTKKPIYSTHRKLMES